MTSNLNISVNGVSPPKKEEEDSECMEDGEIVDNEDLDFIPIVEEKPLDRTSDSDEGSASSDDEPPEIILNSVAKKEVEENRLASKEVDPKLCFMCQKSPYKYRCPKCDLRTCSVQCSKQHKEVKNCDGVRPPFQPVSKLSQFDANKSIQDQRFLHAVQSTVKTLVRSPSVPSTSKGQHFEMIAEEEKRDTVRNESVFASRDGSEENLKGGRHKASSMRERYLIQNALRRRIWLSYSDDKDGEDSSRHEQFSDTIFWCVDFIFNKQLEDGSTSTYSYRVQNIPETIRLVTILRQFLKPRQHGCIVSKSDLDLEKLSPFMEAGIEGVNGFMRVPNFEPERFYLVDLQKDLLHNTRNRVIIDHPKIVITLDTEFITTYCLISEAEAEEIKEKQRQSRAMAQATEEGSSGAFSQDGFRGHRGFRGNRGAPRGGFRGGYQGQNDFRLQRGRRGGPWGRGAGGKRYSDHDSDFSPYHKRGRCGRGGERGPPRNYKNLDEEFDPFEPFEGPIRLPHSYLGSKDDSDHNNTPSDTSTANNQCNSQNDALENWGKCVAEKEK